MKKRIITGAVIAAALIAAVALRQVPKAGIYIFDAFILFIAVMGSLEIAKCLNGKAYKYLSAVFSLAAYALLLTLVLCDVSGGWILIFELNLLIAFIFGILIFEGIKHLFSKPQTEPNKRKCFWCNLLSLIYPTGLFMCFYLINHFAAFEIDARFGFVAIILVFAVSAITDSFAMYTGMLFKGPKLCPKISPKKTISGATGGLVFGTLAAITIFAIFNAITSYKALFSAHNINIGHFALIGLIGSLANQIGDLFESYFKRRVGVKDSGTFFPGHGGFMDRFDGVSFNVAAMFVMFIILL